MCNKSVFALLFFSTLGFASINIIGGHGKGTISSMEIPTAVRQGEDIVIMATTPAGNYLPETRREAYRFRSPYRLFADEFAGEIDHKLNDTNTALDSYCGSGCTIWLEGNDLHIQ